MTEPSGLRWAKGSTTTGRSSRSWRPSGRVDMGNRCTVLTCTRQPYGKARSAPARSFTAYVATVGAGDGLGERQAEARAVLLGGVKEVEDFAAVRFGDARAFVAHADQHAVCFAD